VNDLIIREADSSGAWVNWCGVGPMNKHLPDSEVAPF
jgi:hypothetical protein